MMLRLGVLFSVGCYAVGIFGLMLCWDEVGIFGLILCRVEQAF
ncbi:MAG: hypothetical protein ACK5UY_01230 [Holosporales bacterium]